MDRKDRNEKIELIRYFQNAYFVDRMSQIEPYKGHDSYLDYYVGEKLDPIRYFKIRIKNRIRKNEDCDREVQELIDGIDRNRTVCILSSFYKGKLPDGYTKRVEQVDQQVLTDFKKIYLDHTDLLNKRFLIDRFDDEHIVVRFNSFNEKHQEYIRRIIRATGKTYIHSVHVLMPDIMDYRFINILFDENNKTVLDLHGAVSEELKQFDTPQRADLAKTVEQIVFDLSDKIVCMSKAMADYYVSEYGTDKSKLIVMSIMPFKEGEELNSVKPENGKRRIVYSGGIQKWQNIDRIRESVRKNLGRYHFTIFTQDSERLKEQWSDLRSEDLNIRSGTTEEIYKEYENCDFGYLLRDDNIVNNVSCPTKSIEYIRFGIIPIFKSDRIGDYPEYGLRYIPLEEFDQGMIPDEQERKKMIENNYSVLKKIIRQSEDGKKAIINYLK